MVIAMANDSQNAEFAVSRSTSSSVDCDLECNNDRKMDQSSDFVIKSDSSEPQIKSKLNFSVDRLLNSNSRPLDYSDVKLCMKFENGMSLWRPTPMRAMLCGNICPTGNLTFMSFIFGLKR